MRDALAKGRSRPGQAEERLFSLPQIEQMCYKLQTSPNQIITINYYRNKKRAQGRARSIICTPCLVPVGMVRGRRVSARRLHTFALCNFTHFTTFVMAITTAS